MNRSLCVAMLWVLTSAGCANGTTRPPDDTVRTTPARTEVGYRVRLRWTVLQPSDSIAKLHQLIDRNNTKEQSDAMESGLNPNLVDAAKVDAFLAALDHLPPETKQALARGTILLGDASLYLGVASPALPDNFSTLSGFAKLDQDGDYLVLEPIMRVDLARARQQVERSVAAIAAINARLAKNDPADDLDYDPGALMRTRFQLSWVWRTNLRAIANGAADEATTRETREALEAAERESSGYVVNLGSMPDDDDL